MNRPSEMRPHDIVVLMKLLCLEGRQWTYRDLASSLHISLSEISASIRRSKFARLVHGTENRVSRLALMDFLEHGVKYVYPEAPGALVVGVPTAHSHPYYQHKIVGGIPYVWPDEEGQEYGRAISPLHKRVPNAAMEDQKLYKLLASIDILRAGQVREVNAALEELRKEVL